MGVVYHNGATKHVNHTMHTRTCTQGYARDAGGGLEWGNQLYVG